MTPKELAAKLDGRQYRNEITNEEAEAAEEAGLVVVFGASDDLCEFRGAIDDEAGCGEIAFNADGPVNIYEEDLDVLEKYGVREIVEGRLVKFEALWCESDEALWTYDVPFPHETFFIKEDDEEKPYCKGFVFALADVLDEDGNAVS